MVREAWTTAMLKRAAASRCQPLNRVHASLLGGIGLAVHGRLPHPAGIAPQAKDEDVGILPAE